tara:strand:+ start:4621 stop:9048 length:4428 start_codon:yes stop_codon:yes gene_type:complete
MTQPTDSLRRGRWLLALVVLLALPPLALFVVTPMEARYQAALGIAGVAMMWLLNRLRPQSRLVSLWLVLISMVVSTRYLYWRATETLVFNSGLEYALGYGLFIAEVYAWLIMVLGYLQTIWPLERKITPLPEDTALWPTVDVYIPTYNESLDVVTDTVLAAQNLAYPADRFNVYLLDDGRRPEFAAFASRAGVGYITRDDNLHAKAGNLNNALRQTEGELICVFDCDHVPTVGFLQATVGGFLTDPRLAMLQTPHYFYSLDPFERNLGVNEELPREGELFYGPVQKGNDFWNATFFCGSCAVIRRSALEETNGFAVETVTEDAHTALRLQRLGWNTAFLGMNLAAGLATERLSLHIGQRARWARGMTQILRIDNPLFGRGLSFPQRLCYLNAMLHFQFALPRVVFITAPLAYLLLGQNIIASSAQMIFAYALPHLFHAVYTNARLNGRYRYTFWAEVYESVLAFHLIKPTLMTLWDPRRGKFNVTEKGGMLARGFFDVQSVKPHLIVAFLLIAALGWGGVRYFWNDFYGVERDVMALNLFWAGFSLVTLLGAIGVARERRQRRDRVRVELDLPVSVYLADGHVLRARTRDLSMSGARVANPLKGPLSAPVEDVEIQMDDQRVVLPAADVRVDDMDLRLRFGLLTINQRRALVRIVMGRADAWLPDHEHPGDRPVHSFRMVLRVGLSLFFWRWIRLDRRSREASRNQRRDRFWSVNTIWIFLAVLAVLLMALALRPAFGAEAQAPSLDTPATNTVGNESHSPAANDNGQVLSEVVSLEQLGRREGLLLRGDGAQSGVAVSLRQDEVVTAARMTVLISHGPDLLEGTGQVVVEINGEPVRTLPLQGQDETVHEYSFDINPAYLVTHNQINFRLTGLADRACPNPLDDRVRAVIDGKSHLDMAVRRLPVANQLSALPSPFFDTASSRPAGLRVVFAGAPGRDAVQAAAITATWFGIKARYRGVGFQVFRNELPARNAVVFITNSQTLPGLTLEPVDSPTVRMVNNPRDPLYKLLIIQAPTPVGLVDAARWLALRADSLSGARMPSVPVSPSPRTANDAPLWVNTDKPLDLGELTPPEQLKVTGLYPALINVNFRAAPDLFLWPGDTVPLRVRYRFPEGEWLDTERSRLDVSLNGRYLKSIPVERAGLLERLWGKLGGKVRQEEAAIPVPPDLIYGENRLSFYFNLRYTLEQHCDPVLPKNVTSRIFPDSTLDLSQTQHMATLPNLSFFVAAGYPFSAFADLSRTGLVLKAEPSNDELAAALGLLARIGEATGYPGIHLQVALGDDGIAALRDRDLLALIPLNDPFAKVWLDGDTFMVKDERLKVTPMNLPQRLVYLAKRAAFNQRREAARALTGRTNNLALVSRPSPLNPDRMLVMMTSQTGGALPVMVGDLRNPQVSAQVRGDLVLLDRDGETSGYQVGPVRLYGDIPWYTALLWELGQRPFLMLAGVLLVLLIVVLTMLPLLRRRAALRLDSWSQK